MPNPKKRKTAAKRKKLKNFTLRKSPAKGEARQRRRGKKPAKRGKVLIHPRAKRSARVNKKGNKKNSRYGAGVKKAKKHTIKPKRKILKRKTKSVLKKKSIVRRKIRLKKIIKKNKKPLARFRARKLKKKVIKSRRIHPVKYRSPAKILRSKTWAGKKAVISPKAKLFNRIKKTKRIKKIIPRRIKKQVIKNSPERFPAESLFKAKIKVIGIGGGGGSIVSEIGRSLEKATFVIADTDIRALKKKSGIKYFWFGEDLTHGLGTGVNVGLAKQAAESAKEKISGIFKDQDIVIFVASLGGGLGSGATQVFAEAAREFGGITFGIFTMPFKFEGKNKHRIAQNALKSLRHSLNVSLVIPNEKIFKIIDEATPITNAFSTVNKSLIESLESLIDLIYNPGIINIDFADLRTILRGRGNSAFLNTIEESGKARVEKICEKIFKNPLLQNSSFKAEKILFNIAGSENLSMFEVEKISSHIASLNPKAKIIFGISKNSKLKNKIKTTILMTGAPSGLQIKEDVPVKKMETIKAAAVEKIRKPFKKEAVVVKKEKSSLTSLPSRARKTKSAKNLPAQAGKKPGIKEEKPVSFIPVFEVPDTGYPGDPLGRIPVLEQNKMNITEIAQASNKKTIRRSGLEIKKAEELQEKKRIAQEKEWEIPAFLRKVKLR